MIVLNVEDYCHTCQYFEPKLFKGSTAHGQDEMGHPVEFVFENDMVVCEHRDICANLYDFIKGLPYSNIIVGVKDDYPEFMVKRMNVLWKEDDDNEGY